MAVREVLTVVPRLLGLPAAEAHDVALDARLLAVEQALRPGDSGEVAVVLAQAPGPGEYLPPGGRVRIWVGPRPPGGGGGNLPVSPTPTPVAPSGTV